MITEQITPIAAAELCRLIARDLPEYFGLPEVNELYAQGVQTRTNFAVRIREEYSGLLSLDFPYPESASIYWLGLLRADHGKSIGKTLVLEAEKVARQRGAKFITVETLSPTQGDENYKKTYMFYKASGFVPMFDLKPEGYECIMVYMIKKL